MRILFVPGIKTWQWYLTGWKKDLEEYFPDIEIVFLDKPIYIHTQKKKCDEIVKHGVEILDDGKPTVILAHSFGGILAKTMIKRAKNHKVIKLITMASPHTMKAFLVESTKKFLQTPESVEVPTITFGGTLDPIVPYKYTKTKNSTHENFVCEHMAFLLSASIRKKVLKFILN